MLRALFLVLAVCMAASGAHAQNFNGYTYDPYTGCCNGQITGSPTGTDFIGVSRVGPGNVNITGALPLSAFASAADVQALSGRLDQAFQDLNGQIADLKRGMAATVAMASASMPSAPGRTSWTANTSFFSGEVGAGFSVAHRLNLNVPLAVTASYGNGGGNFHVGRIGLMGEF